MNFKGKNIVITAGGTSEYIDSVRKITNSSTGKLGYKICKSLLANDTNSNIFYIHGKDAMKLEGDSRVNNICITTTSDLMNEVENVLINNKIDIFIHLMAVSDYHVKSVFSYEDFKNKILNEVKEKSYIDEAKLDELFNTSIIDNSSKISSTIHEPGIILKENPKIISLIKKLSPYTFLVGFKLLNNVDEEKLFDVGFNLLRKNRCNLVVANDLAEIKKGNHKALIIYPEKNYDIVIGKDNIAKNLVDIIYNRAFVKHPKSICLSNNNYLNKDVFNEMKSTGALLFNKGLLPVVINHNRLDKFGTYGNLSVKNTDNSFFITGRNVHKGELKEDDICKIDNVEEITNHDSIFANVNYRGTLKPSIDSAIHSALYKATKFTHIIHIHTKKVFLGVPITDYNYPCGSMEEKDAILNFVSKNSNENVVQLYKHGLIIMGNSFDECLMHLDKLFNTTPYINYDKKNIYNDEFTNHVYEVEGLFVFQFGDIFPIEINDNCIGTLWENITNDSVEFALYSNINVRNKGYNLVRKYLSIYNKKMRLYTMSKCNIYQFYVDKFNFSIKENSNNLIILEN